MILKFFIDDQTIHTPNIIERRFFVSRKLYSLSICNIFLYKSDVLIRLDENVQQSIVI